MTKSTKIGASILATALLSTVALTSITHANNVQIDETKEPVEFTTAIDEKTFTFDPEVLVEINADDVAAFEKEFENISDADLKKRDAEFTTEQTEADKLRDKIDKVISDDDWATLSMKQIDDKLVAAGLAKLGDEANDPYYTKTVEQIDAELENMTEAEWAALEAEFEKAASELE